MKNVAQNRVKLIAKHATNHIPKVKQTYIKILILA